MAATTEDEVRHYDAIVVGAGPTGLTVANLLAIRGIRVCVFEKHTDRYLFPRAGHIDHEALRIIQEAGALEPVLEDAVPWTSNRWLTAAGDLLFEFKHWSESASGFHSSGFFQPTLEHALYEGLARNSSFVTVHQGRAVEHFEQDEREVRVDARSVRGNESIRAAARYLLAADGASSSIRQKLNIARSDAGYAETWCCVDVAYVRARDFGPPSIIGDPKRPRYFGPLGKRHHRFEWKVMPDEMDLDHSQPDVVWDVMKRHDVSPDDVKIIRQVTYDFEYRMAVRWRDRRVILMGDAAHTTPPALGQGMCSGMRDAMNLAWKLALVIENRAEPSLLDTYHSERLPHVTAWSDMSLLASQVAFTCDAEVAAQRDARIRRGEKPDFGPSPHIGPGILARASSVASRLAGEMFPQRNVSHDGKTGRFDDLAGPGFLMVAWADVRPHLTPAAVEICGRLGVRFVNFGDDGCFEDHDNRYENFFRDHGVAAVLVRPDKYIFGAAVELDGVSGMIEEIGGLISAPRTSAPIHFKAAKVTSNVS